MPTNIFAYISRGDITMKTETLAQYLARVMKERRLSASDVERRSRSEITDEYINYVASGKQKNITVAKLVSLAKGLGDDPHNLLNVAMGVAVHQSSVSRPSHTPLKATGRIVDDSAPSDIRNVLLQMDARVLIVCKATAPARSRSGARNSRRKKHS
jgi:transcriptional regulator with XRE-family HTH domain